MTDKINPKFDTDRLKNPEVINMEVRNLIISEEPVPHSEILKELLSQIEPLDIEAKAFPQAELLLKRLSEIDAESEEAELIKKELNRLILKEKHLLILAIENVLKKAEKNRWGLCLSHDFVYIFNGKFWEVLDEKTLQKFLGEAAEKLGVGKYTARYFRFRENLLKQFVATAYLPKPEPDSEKVLINLKNGTFEISPAANKLRPFDKDDFLKYQLPFCYDENAESPLFHKYLDRVLPEKEKQMVVAEYLGYVLLRNAGKLLKIEKVLMLYGPGANGKSVLFEIVNALLGIENVSSYSLQSLTNNPTFRARLENVLVNFASELSGKMESSTFKQLVSGEPIEARLLFKNPYILREYAKLIFNVNELPRDVEHTHAFFRRFLIIPFEVTIPPEEQDKNLHTKIIEKELPGIFNWVLEGLQRLLKQEGFSPCEAAERAVEQYKIESNSVSLYLREKSYVRSSSDYRRIKELYEDYKEFCNEDRLVPFGKRNFVKQLKALGFHVAREAGTGKYIVYLAEDVLKNNS